MVNASGSVIQTYDYYPFGLEMPGRSLTTGTTARERFTGHERDEEVGLDYMQARRYAAEFGRFLSVDPLADEYPSWSPYNYTLNNPLKFIDPTGHCPEQTNDSWCIDDFGFENHGLLGRIMNYLLTTDSEIGSENYNSRDFSEVVYEGVVDEVTEVANEVKEETLDVAETSVGIGILVADNVSLASDIALPAAFMFGPKGIAIVGGIGTVADVTSLGLKGVDLLMFDGSQEVLSAQFKKTVFNYGKGMGLNKVSRYHR